MTNFENEIRALKDELLAMASHAETAVSRALRAVSEADMELARAVRGDDNVLDHLEMQIDDTAIHLLAMAPVAFDLRLITVAMKISQNLERVGDEACSMAKGALDLAGQPRLEADTAIPQMARLAIGMLHDAISSFVERDPAKARGIIPRDKEVDALNRELHRALSSFIAEDPQKITRCLALMGVSKSIERIADHATNIAEDVVYLYEGCDIRHKNMAVP